VVFQARLLVYEVYDNWKHHLLVQFKALAEMIHMLAASSATTARKLNAARMSQFIEWDNGTFDP
jgi:hypothetical protein